MEHSWGNVAKTPCIESFNSFTNNSRKHDMSDAMLMILYYHFTKLKEKKKSKIIVDFEMFRYK